MKNAVIGLLLLTYPFIIYFGLAHIAPTILAILLAILFILRHVKQLKSNTSNKTKIPHINLLLINVLCLLAYTSITNSPIALKLYPVVVNLSFFFIFSYSLYRPPSVVEVIARMKDDLDEKGVIYTRKITVIWCFFFLLNAAIATWTVFHVNPQYWLIYNGLISYILIGLLVTGEIIYRRFFIDTPSNSRQNGSN